MPPPLLIDIDRVDLTQCRMTQEQVYDILPHRHEFRLIKAVCHLDLDRGHLISYMDLREDDWWVRGHIPGRPILPGVLLLEMAAQTAALLAMLSPEVDAPFIGFGGVEACKFRGAVIPPARVYALCVRVDLRPRRVVADTQGLLNGDIVFEARVTGLAMK